MLRKVNPIVLQCSPLHKLPPYVWVCVRSVINLSYKIIGETSTDPEEPPIMFFHGLLGSKKHWTSLGKTIVNITKRSVITVDLRNHGGSPHVNSHKYEDLASDVLQLLKKLEIDKASLIGHSMGGMTAMCVSLMAPEKVAGILVIDISPVSTSVQLKDMSKLLAAMKKLDFKNPKKPSHARKEAKKQLKYIIKDDVMMNAVLHNIKVKSDGTIGWFCNLDTLIRHFKYIESFPQSLKGKKYPGPALFIGGQMSEYLPPDDLIGIREMFPQAVITYIPKAGHNVHADDPKSFLEQAIAFLRTNQ